MENKAPSNTRLPGLDLVRVCASIFVVAVHFYLNCGYYSEYMVGNKMFIMTFFRWFFMISVPLFIMLTGYLKINNTICKKHYLALLPIIISYIIISIIKVLTANKFYGEGYYSIPSAIKQISSYQMAWYVGMYVSLILLIPFLNKLWHSLKSKKEKQILIGSLAFVACLYPLLLFIAPSYWQMLYPFVYYFLGAYIREFQPVIKKWIAILTILILTLLEAAISFYFAKGALFNWNILCGTDSGYNVITVVISAFMFFVLIYHTEIKNTLISKLLKLLSSLSFEIYLFTGVFDVIIFSYLKRSVNGANEFFFWPFATVPLNFILSSIAAFLVHKLVSVIVSAINKQN